VPQSSTQRYLSEKRGREQSYVGRIETSQRRLDLVEFVWICRVCGADPGKEAGRVIRGIKRKL
jgi:hypothetical protein